MTLRLAGSTSGYTEIDAPAVAGNNTLVLPTGNGSNGQFLQGNGSGALSWSGSLTLATAQNSTSGTNIDFTGIPSWVKRVTVMFNGVSTNGTSPPQIQLGTSSGIDATGYIGSNSIIIGATSFAAALFTTGFGIGVNTSNWGAAFVASGAVTISLLGSNGWAAQGVTGTSDAARIFSTAGFKSLSGTLDRVRITTVNGTDTFDAGSINILYEG